jgi:hypothetical protein
LGTGIEPAATVATPSCTFSSVDSAVLGGGTVQFGADCSLTDSSAIVISTNLSVAITSGGYSVSLSGGYTNQLFVVNGGHLTIDNITLTSGIATASAGTNGAAGLAGTAGINGNPGAGATGAPGLSLSRPRAPGRLGFGIPLVGLPLAGPEVPNGSTRLSKRLRPSPRPAGHAPTVAPTL